MMKILLILTVVLSKNSNTIAISAPTTAILEIADKFFINQSMNFNVFVHNNRRIDKVLSLLKVPVKVENMNLSKYHQTDESAILIFNETQWFLEFYIKMAPAYESARELYFFVYIENFKREDVDRLMPQQLVYHHFNFLFNLEGEDSIDLVTFAIFQQPKCRQSHSLTINRFSIKEKKWKSQKFSIKHFRNFNGCELVFGDDFGVLNSSLYSNIYQIVESSLNFTTTIWTTDTGIKKLNFVKTFFEKSSNKL
jgi:hypothetical protein